MVQVGRDSDACVCAVKRDGAPTSSLGAGAAVAVAAVARLRGEEQPEDLQGGADAASRPGLIPKIRVPLSGSGRSRRCRRIAVARGGSRSQGDLAPPRRPARFAERVGDDHLVARRRRRPAR